MSRTTDYLNKVEKKDAFVGISAVSKSTLPEQIYLSLREALMSGRFVPGQRVPLRTLASVMGTSTMPVREAVNRLVAVGALELLPNRRVAVPKVSIDRYLDLMKARVVIECAAAEEAITAITSETIKELEYFNKCMYSALDKPYNNENVHDYLDFNRKFHFAIYSCIESSTLIGVIESLWIQAGPYFNLLHGETSRWNPQDRHDDIIKAYKTKNKSLAKKSIRADIEEAVNYLVNNKLI